MSRFTIRLCAGVAVGGFAVGEGWNGHGTRTLGLYVLAAAAAVALIAAIEIGVVVLAHHWAWRRQRRGVIEVVQVRQRRKAA